MYVSTSGEYCLICWLARFSLVITRSMTSSMVRGLSAGLGASVAAMAPTPLKIRMKIVVTTLRIFSLPSISISQTEFNSHARRKIHRLTFAPCRLELDLLCCASCCFIKTMAETTHNPVHLNASVRQEYHLENNVAFNSQSTPFRGVLRTRFFQNVNRGRGAFTVRRSLLGRLGRHRLIRESGGLQRAALAAWRRIRRAVAETSARHRAAYSFVAAGSVAISRSTRQCG